MIWNYLNAESLPYFRGHLSQFYWTDAAPFHLPNGMKDMADTSCKDRASNGEYTNVS